MNTNNIDTNNNMLFLNKYKLLTNILNKFSISNNHI